MKRILSLVISFALVLATLSAPAYAKKEQAEESWLTMQGFGVVDDQDNATTTFTVAELCEMVYRLMNFGVKEVPEATHQIYTDVDRWYWAAGYMEWLYDNRIYTGDGSGSLQPEKKATLTDVCTVMVNLLGYQKVGEILNESINPIQKAGELGVLPASVSRAEHELTYGEFAAICYELLFADVMEVTFDDNIGFSQSREFINAVLELDYQEGVLTGANRYSLTYQECGEDEVVIGDISLTTPEGKDFSEYLGYRVQYYYDAKTNDLVAVVPMENTVLTLTTEEILEYENNRYTYEEGEKEKKAKVSTEVMLLYNGKITTNRDAFLPPYGQVTLIDNNEDGFYDCIISEYAVNLVLDKVVNGVIYAKNADRTGRKYSLDLEEMEYYAVIGAEKLEELKENAVISAVVSEDGTIGRFYVSEEKVTGVLGAFAEDEIIVGGETYLPAVQLFNPNMINTPGNDIQILLDCYGNVAAILGNYEGKYQLGYLMDVRDDDVEDKLILKILTSDSQVKKIYTADKLYINGDKTESTEGAKESLVVNELIKYRMSGEEIKYIDTAVKKKGFETYQSASDKDSLRMIADGTMIYKSVSQLFKKYSTMSLHGEFAVNDQTQIFFIPADETNADDDDYYVGNRTGLSDDFNGTVQGYVTGAFTLMADAAVVKHKTTIKHGTAITVVESVVQTIDENDDVIYKINGMRSGKDVEIIVRDAELLNTNNGTVDKGSVIRYQTDKNGVVKTIEHMYNPENKEGVLYTNASHTYTHTSSGVNAHVRIMLGTIQSHYGTIAQFRFLDEVSADRDEVFNLKNCNVYVYDASEKDSVRAGTIDEVRDFSYYGSLGDEVIIATRAVTTSDVIILKK